MSIYNYKDIADCVDADARVRFKGATGQDSIKASHITVNEAVDMHERANDEAIEMEINRLMEK